MNAAKNGGGDKKPITTHICQTQEPEERLIKVNGEFKSEKIQGNKKSS